MFHEQDYAHAESLQEAAHARGTTHPPRDGRRGAPRRWPDQPGDRRQALHFRTYGGEPRRADPKQARIPLTNPDRSLVCRDEVAAGAAQQSWRTDSRLRPAARRPGRGHAREDSQPCLDADGRGDRGHFGPYGRRRNAVGARASLIGSDEHSSRYWCDRLFGRREPPWRDLSLWPWTAVITCTSSMAIGFA